MANIDKLKSNYEKACMAYISEFSKKQDMVFDGWVGNEVGGIAYFDDFFLNFSDIVWDINSVQPKGLILKWYYEGIENHPKSINYYSYSKGLMFSDLSDTPILSAKEINECWAKAIERINSAPV